MKKDNVVLIVDQNPTRKNNLSTRLRMMGYTTELSSSGFHALHLIEDSDAANKKKSYRLILLMGDSEDMPGREIMLLMRELQKDKNKLPILIVSEDNDPDTILTMIQDGANDYLVDINNDGKIVTKIQKMAPPKEK